MDIKRNLLSLGHCVCFAGDFPTDRLIKLWDETEKRLANIENMNLRSIIINTLNHRNIKVDGINV